MASLIFFFLIKDLQYEAQRLIEGKILGGVIIRVITFSILLIKCHIPVGYL